MTMDGGVELATRVVVICGRSHCIHSFDERIQLVKGPSVVARDSCPSVVVVLRPTVERHLICSR